MICEFPSIDDKISFICINEFGYFFGKQNVVGVGLGYKFKNGFYTCQKCIKVFVCKKVTCCNLSENDLVPTFYKGIPTDVCEIGIPQFQSLTQKVRPTVCGYSIGPEGIGPAVTLGCIVKDAHGVYILTCNHGIINEIKPVPVGMRVLQPGVEDGGISPRDVIGNLSYYVPLKEPTTWSYHANPVDACLIKVPDPRLLSTQIYSIGKPHGIEDAHVNQQVTKAGRTTALTTGSVIAINASIDVYYNYKHFVLSKQIATTKMSEPGDSGALLLNPANNNAVGLISTGTNSYSFASTIKNTLTALGVTLVTD